MSVEAHGQPDGLLPLYVDLDHTLVRTDSLAESFFNLLKRSPLGALVVLFALALGRSRFKQRLAAAVALDPALLPYNDQVLSLVQRWRDGGGRVVLASAAHETIVSAVARHLGGFEDTLSTRSNGANLKGRRKLEAIRAHAGNEAFAYCGDSPADLPILAAAQQRFVVVGSTRLPRELRKRRLDFEIVDVSRPSVKLVLRQLRVHQWLKNLLLFLPLLAAHRWQEINAVAITAGAFVCFGLVASATYVLNDLLDLDCDRRHPRKRMRPIASGRISIEYAVFMAVGTFIAGILISMSIHPQLPALLLGYVALTVLYSTVLKAYAVIDVLMLAGLYTYRVLAGAMLISIHVSSWMLAFCMSLFFSLALVKRLSEIKRFDSSQQQWIAGRGYRKDDWPVLLSLGAASSVSTVVLTALYLESTQAHGMYSAPERLWMVCPLLLYWLSRLWLKTSRGEMTDDPLVFTMKDRGSLVPLACVAALFVWAI